jgi:hypothetical protein
MKLVTMKEISGIRVGTLMSLKSVLDEWRELTNREKWFFEEDATWWNNERASLSVFAGAIWRRKGLVMEEFATEKTMRSEPKAGRCDITFRIRRKVFLGEAKQQWPLLTKENVPENFEETNRLIKQACDESLRTKDSKAIHLGIVFITPRIHNGKMQFLDDLLLDYINVLSARKDITLAWVFPRWARDLHSSESGFENYIYPGVVLAIKKAG